MTFVVDEEVLQHIRSGAAVCFFGAGFASEGSDAQGRDVPTAGQLVDEIFHLLNLNPEKNTSLSDLADYCQTVPGLDAKLSEFLISRLTNCTPSAEQRRIIKAPWKSLFTTNFDDVIEKCLSDRVIQIVTSVSDSTVLSPSKTPIFYIHGRALDLLEKRSKPSIVISESNYLALEQNNKNLYSALINEMHAAASIVFIGYSLRDLDVAKLIVGETESFRDKTVIVCGENEGLVAQQRLSKFGRVLPIGVKGFASQFPEKFEAIDKRSAESPIFINKIAASETSGDVAVSDVLRLVMSGELDRDKYAAQVADMNATKLYCVSRIARVSEIFDHHGRGVNRAIVTADIGNGKSVFLDQVINEGQRRGFVVYKLESTLREVLREIDIILAQKVRHLIVIDDVIRYRNILKYIGERLTTLGLLVCGARDTSEGLRFDILVREMGGAARERLT